MFASRWPRHTAAWPGDAPQQASVGETLFDHNIPMIGRVGHFALFDYVISATQVKQLYLVGMNGRQITRSAGPFARTNAVSLSRASGAIASTGVVKRSAGSFSTG